MSVDRSVKFGKTAIGNVIITGDRNSVNADVHVEPTKIELPPASAVDIAREIASIRVILESSVGEHANKIVRALDDAAEEARKPNPDRNSIGSSQMGPPL
jgi:predicted metal-dependent TIM-barrel fold hydrolase